MNCIVCGKPISPPKKKFCGSVCSHRYHNGLKGGEAVETTCLTCGRRFTATKKGQKYCSRECTRRDNARRLREYRAAHRESAENPKPREITPTTVYLVHKWTAEGMPVGAIAQTLERCAEDVNRALSQPITEEQAEAIRECFVQYKPRRAEE